MKINPYRYLLSSSNDSRKITIGSETISRSKCEILLGIKIDNNPSFKEHIESLCKKASQKINALARLASSINFEERRLKITFFVVCHCSFCPVVWMFISCKLNARFNKEI